MTKSQRHWIKIADFPIKAHFWVKPHCGWLRNMLLLENPQFSSDFFDTLPKCLIHEWVILTKSQKILIKIVDFPIKAHFWVRN